MTYKLCTRPLRLLLILLALTLACSAACGEEQDPSSLRLREMFSTQREGVSWESMTDVPFASDYLLAHADRAAYAGEAIACGMERVSDMQVVLHADVPQSALYTLRWTYASQETTSDVYAAVTFDGLTPYQEAASARFRWQWREVEKPQRNTLGDDVRPQQERISDTNTAMFDNVDGYLEGPLKIYLEAGKHEITLDFVSKPVDILSCELLAPDIPRAYEEVLAEAVDRGYQPAKHCLTLEAEEHVKSKNNASIQRTASEDPVSTPYEKGYKRLNTLGGGNYASGGQEVTWAFTVPEDGLYAISLRMATATDQLPVYRSLRLDGQLPFAEAAHIQFPWQDTLRLYTIPYLFPLTAGEHTLTLTAQVGEFYPVILALRDINDDMSEMMLDIVMLVGTNPDANYDYDVEKSIPDILERLSNLSDRMLEQCAVLRSVCGTSSLAENSLRQNAELLMVIGRNLQRIQNNIGDLTNIQTSLATWETTLRNQPLQLDKILIGQLEDENDLMAASAWQTAEAMLYQFLVSFSKDYDQVGGRAGNEDLIVLDVWASMSIEVADILKNLCDSTFTPETGIAINLNIMPAGQLNAGAVNALMLAIVSGNEPDVALGVSTTTPVELAIRDAVVDLSKLPGYEALAAQYPANALVANSFMGGVYGIPEKLDFTVMFYRKDILSALNLPVPETWEELYTEVLPMLYQNNLEMYVPQDYATFLYQHGGAFYTPDGLATALGDPKCYQAFKEMVELYTKYAIPYTTNFYNRFRTGEMPMGVGKFSDYMSLTVGAGNLSGKWGITTIPGVRREDGSVSHATTGAVTSSAMIMSACEEQEAAWQFLQWWLSAETQKLYAEEVEMRIGVGSRVNTANTEAFRELSWPAEDLRVLLEVRESAVETPGVLGGAYTSRHINNAWNAVITDADQSVIRDEFEHAIEMIEIEMKNKQAEYAHLLD